MVFFFGYYFLKVSCIFYEVNAECSLFAIKPLLDFLLSKFLFRCFLLFFIFNKEYFFWFCFYFCFWKKNWGDDKQLIGKSKYFKWFSFLDSDATSWWTYKVMLFIWFLGTVTYMIVFWIHARMIRLDACFVLFSVTQFYYSVFVT